MILRKITDPYDGDEEIAILYRKPMKKLSLWARFKGWIINVFK